MAKRQPKSTKAGRKIIAALTELADSLGRGEAIDARYTVRTVTLPDEPGVYGPADVRALRDSLHASQAVFARLLSVSAKLVQAWERGDRQPAGPARRLMDDMVADPAKWKRFLRPPGNPAAAVTLRPGKRAAG